VVPVITMSKLNVVMPFALEEMPSVSVVATTWFAVSTEFSRSQVRVTGPLALVGLQFVFVMLTVSGTLPMFLT